jgi:hypothetical protein
MTKDLNLEAVNSALSGQVQKLLAELKAADKRNAELMKLREVLEPFAKAAYGFDSYNIHDPEEWFAYSGVKSAEGTTGAITVGDLRRARTVLSGDKHE